MPTKTSDTIKNGPNSREDQDFLNKYGDKLSSTTQRAKWIESPREHAERKGQSLATRSHDVIQDWAKQRGASPASAPRTRTLRLDFPGYGGKNLEKMSWDAWFKAFDDRHLVFLYQEHLRNGNTSNFFRLDSPNRRDA